MKFETNKRLHRLRSSLTSFLAAMSVAACQPGNIGKSSVELEYLQMPIYAGQDLPFSTAVRVDNTLYLSGVIGTDPNADTLVPIPGGIGAETKRALEIIKEELETFGSSMEKVVKCTIYLADIDEWTAMNDVYITFFETPPARSALGANGLAIGARVEIECIAVVD